MLSLGLFDDTTGRGDDPLCVGFETDAEQAPVERCVGAGVDAIDESFVLSDVLNQSARFAFTQYVREQVEIAGVSIAEARGRPGQIDSMSFERPSQERHAQFPGQRSVGANPSRNAAMCVRE